MKVSAARITAAAGVNEVRAIFEGCGCVFQSVAQENDYGKDAYVDHADEDRTVTGFCVALQIKSGPSFRKASGGYVIRVGDHRSVWQNSSLPVAGVVYDPGVGTYWVNISRYLRQHPEAASIPVDGGRELTAESARDQFWSDMRDPAFTRDAASLGAKLVDASDEVVRDALLDSFAQARRDARHLILVRRLLTSFTGESLRLAACLLSLATAHPDVYWNDSNFLPKAVKATLRRTYTWSKEEIVRLLSAEECEGWRRGGIGQSIYHLLVEDDAITTKVEAVLSEAYDNGQATGEVASALLIQLHDEESAVPMWDRILTTEPRIMASGGAADVDRELREHGWLSMF